MVKLSLNSTANQTMDLPDSRNRQSRKLPTFMYGATYPRDSIGSGGSAYGGALEWLKKHQEYLNQSLRYVQRYPNLIQDRVMDPFWDFLEPLVYNNNLLTKYDDFLRTQFGLNECYKVEEGFGQRLPTAATYFKADSFQRNTEYTYPIRRVFFCYDRSCSKQQKLKHLIVDQLEPFVCVRTNPTAEQAKAVSSMDFCRTICGSAFVMLVNDEIFKDQVCMNLLSIAVAYKTPIVFLRESGYTLPDDLPDTNIEYVKPPSNAPFVPSRSSLSENTTPPSATSKTKEDNSCKEKRLKEENVDSELSVGLATKIRELYGDALVFNTNLYESTLALLYDKIALYTGATFPSSVPQQAIDDAIQLTKVSNIASLKLPDRPVYKAGSARTTRDFHQTHYRNSNNNSSTTSPTPTLTEAWESRPESRVTGRISYAGSYSDDSGILDATDVRKTTSTAIPRTCNSPIEGFAYSSAVPHPLKVMRSSNLQGQLTDPLSSSRFRPNYPSNSRLLRYRPSSSRPNSARSRVLLNSSLYANSAEEE